MAISVKLPVFEGPLDLLLHLIDKNKIDIYDIPIAEITDQYMEYVRQMDREDMDVVSEFLVMAATLLDIKCRMLLPIDETAQEEADDPRAELVEQLLEYKMCKYMSFALKDRFVEAERNFYRKPDIPEEVRSYQPPVDYEQLIGDLTLAGLQRIFRETMKRKEDKVDPVRSHFGKIEKEEIDLDEKTLFVEAYLQTHGKCDFRKLLEKQNSKAEIIVTFLIILELMRTNKIVVEQDDLFTEITITYKAAG